MFKLALLALVALFGSSAALKAPLGLKIGRSRVATGPVAKVGGVAALSAIFSAAPVWAKDAALQISPYGTGGEGTGDMLGINDSKLLYVLVAMCGAVFTLFVTNGNSIEDGDDDFFGEIDNRR
ncbi:hypothetical protein T492DRAFT_892242 [Pavlovales sp. CCMP2436]|nr:hypothetical protein T492DRAFT_892242 [Pavlovales sp. CCMP2436]|mmetsp:Transcript_14956/g.34805  ORF Transcript_14956/g.34805 Transcript_14956/m.34805 type:complete len:123 (+) Transcript_14956:97-465(+)|eukprot:CAMPEP_0179850270 /NCGR_PEP_ID=MMETSP0982-20121206/7610_1 /TAXON_ID=483367 /ORGANISM="non described non described, Strain CCMP 2436" /LENGTH=122 /DNA_ID=CAMNT_0021735677 /DNA_START=194 /DNA_END=562 /DNA_ORIENTATION=-